MSPCPCAAPGCSRCWHCLEVLCCWAEGQAEVWLVLRGAVPQICCTKAVWLSISRVSICQDVMPLKELIWQADVLPRQRLWPEPCRRFWTTPKYGVHAILRPAYSAAQRPHAGKGNAKEAVS